MQYIFVLFCSLVLPLLALREMKPKFCANCKYFITDNDTGKYGRCALFQKKEENAYFLVTGSQEEKLTDYRYCATARESEDMCGKEGKMHKRKYSKRVI